MLSRSVAIPVLVIVNKVPMSPAQRGVFSKSIGLNQQGIEFFICNMGEIVGEHKPG